MTIYVRYLSEDEIEKETELLLAEYAETIGGSIKLPVPVADITTYHFALRLGFADLHATLRIPMRRDQPDILGAIWIDTETVLIDCSLDPKHNPSIGGRYRFSVAHEIGHWRLHRPYVTKDPNQPSLFDNSSEPTVICRSSQAKDPIEWQADFFSSCLPMPRRRVHEEWKERLGRTRPLVSLRRVSRDNGGFISFEKSSPIISFRGASQLGWRLVQILRIPVNRSGNSPFNFGRSNLIHWSGKFPSTAAAVALSRRS